MATMALAMVATSLPAAPRERIDLENALRLWSLGVRFATRDLVALGRPLELRLALPAATATPLDELAPLGFEVAPLYGSHVMRVTNVVVPRVGARVVGRHDAPTPPGVSRLDGLQLDDFLVGIEGDDLLLAPSTGLAQVRKRILAACRAAIARGGGGGVTLQFVRLDALVQVDPTRRVTHGSVLRALDRLEKRHADLKARYDQLLAQNRAAVTQRLTRHKMLLGFGIHSVQKLRNAVLEDERYRFAAKFQEWYAAIIAQTEYEGDVHENDDDDVEVDGVDADVAMEPSVSEFDGSSTLGGDSGDVSNVRSILPVAVDPTQPPAQPRPKDIDVRWRDVLRPQEMRWLPQAEAVLTNFIEGVVNAFASDGAWAPEMVTRSRSIAERLVRMYAAKLVSSQLDNATVKKEFVQHARMIRSNLANPGNKLLRSEVLSGVITIDDICSMTSDQLAPKSLQEHRQRRYEQHAKEITITAPSGPILMKTKHGFKEVNVAATLGGMHEDIPDDTGTSVTEAATTTVTTMSSGLVTDGVHPTTSTSSTIPRTANTADEVAQRLSVLGVNTSSVEEKKDCDQTIVPSSNHQGSSTSSARNREKQEEVSKDAAKPPTLENVTITSQDFRKFLMVMFDPAQDLEGTIAQLQSAIRSAPLSTMSNEFVLAPGVMLYRDVLSSQSQHGSVHFRARVRLLNWTFYYDASSDREATICALNQLIKELQECRRLVGRLLDQLRHDCDFPQPPSNQQAYRLAMNVLVHDGMVNVTHQTLYHRGRDGMIQEHRAGARIGGMDIVTVSSDSIIAARESAARSAAEFMSELVALRGSTVHSRHTSSQGASTSEYQSLDNAQFDRQQFQHEVHHDNGAQFQDKYHVTDDKSRVMLDRKRPFDHSSNQADIVQPEPIRRKVETPVLGGFTEAPQPDQPPVEQAGFIIDTKGEKRQPPVDPAEQERKEKLQVETYQELLKELIRNRDEVKARASFDWNPNIPDQMINFTSRLKVTRSISQVSGDFVCSLQGLDGNLFITHTKASIKEAADYVTGKLNAWLDDIYNDWCNLATAYNRIVERKLLQRGHQADARLSAANETRKDRSVSSFTDEKEKTRGALSEYTVYVRMLPAVRQVCLNMKMAKRAAGEEFRDLMEWINKTRQESLRGQRAPQARVTNQSASATQRSSAPSAPPGRAPPKPRKPSNMVVCSDDSDDDDDDDDYHDGGGYSDDDDWHPQPKSADTKQKEYGAVNVRTRVDEFIRQPYPLESERSDSDDARFRAVIRSLFTPKDELCAGISGIRGALKYRGHFDKLIVPNVKASIRLELLRGDTFNVYAAVNDVIHCRATASSKPEACDMAVNGLLQELDSIRQVWTELIHFYHTKELSNNDPMDSFNALRLANITKIETLIESPAIHRHNRMIEAKMAMDVHCAIYFGGKVVYRVNEAVETDAHTMAMCRALRFIIDLIDNGLDPTPIGQQDQRFAPLLDANLRCKVILHDFGDRKREVVFFADAQWAIQGRVPSKEFGLPERLTLNQLDRIPMPTFERTFGSSADPNIFYFRLDATYENGKFLNHIAEYGNKNKMRAYVLHLEVLENTSLDVFLFPPAASVNSTGNLYWSRVVMPREIDDFKAVYGYVVRRRPPQRR